MQSVKNLFSSIAYELVRCQIDFYDSESHQGDSYMPFIGFMVFLIGMVVLFLGVVRLTSAKRQFNIFYDQRDKQDYTEEKYKKERTIGKIMIIAGAVMMVGSYFIY